MTTTQRHTVTLEVLDCANCGVPFGVSVDWLNRRRDDGRDFYCPGGHVNVYRVSEIDKLRKERERLLRDREYWQNEERKEREARQAAERREAAQKGAKTKLKKRIAGGACPCCKRTFQNLARHMQTQHPEFATVPDSADADPSDVKP